MKQHEAVIIVMEANGGYATLGFLYQNVLNVEDCTWKTKTPLASIRRIVQNKRFFFKIRPGLWALKSYKNRLPRHIYSSNKALKSKQGGFDHAFYQGLLVEMGNLMSYWTHVPNQDRNRMFLDKRLGEISTVKRLFPFGYDHIMKKAGTVDVCWFNDRKMPDTFFEVEHTTDFQNSLLKFSELQDYNTNFFMVADKSRERAFLSKLTLSAFSPIRKRVKFLNYDGLSEWHSKAHALADLEKDLSL